MKKTKRHYLLTMFLSGLFAIAASLIYFGPQIIFCLKARKFVSSWFSVVPVPLTDHQISTAPATVLSYFGYRVEVPWTGIERERNDGRIAEVSFRTGQVFTFINPIYSEDPLSRYWEPGVFNNPFGPHPPGSRYEHSQAVLDMTPGKLFPLESHRRFARDRVYLVSKSLWLEHSGAQKIFLIANGAYKGFEISGIPYNGRIGLTLFDAANNQFDLELSMQPTLGFIHQNEINRIIVSFAAISSVAISSPTP